MYDLAIIRCGSDEHLLECPLSMWSGDLRRCRWCDEPLTGRKQRWCSGRCAGEMGKHHWWGYARKERVRIDGGVCQACGATGTEVHHRVPLHTLTIAVERLSSIGSELVTRRVRHSDGGCWHHLDGLVTLCHDCHQAAHRALPVPHIPGQLRMEATA